MRSVRGVAWPTTGRSPTRAGRRTRDVRARAGTRARAARRRACGCRAGASGRVCAGVIVGRLVPKIVRTGRENVSVIGRSGASSTPAAGWTSACAQRAGREPAQPRGLAAFAPRHAAPRATETLPARSCADADRPTSTVRRAWAKRSVCCLTVHTQHDLPHRRAEPRRRPGRPAASSSQRPREARARRAHDEAGRRGAADEPARPARAPDGQLDGELLAEP